MPNTNINRRVLYKSPVVASSTSLLLDLAAFQNPFVAYSFHKLNSSYVGYCIDVRRSSDDTILSIGFVNDELDTASMLTFVGVGNGFISKRYDQSGNGRDETQPVKAAQIKIVNAGVLIVDPVNGKPAALCTPTTEVALGTVSGAVNIGKDYSMAGVVNYTSPIPANGSEWMGGYENNVGFYLDSANSLIFHQCSDNVDFTYWLQTLASPITLDVPHSIFLFRNNLNPMNFYLDNVNIGNPVVNGSVNFDFNFRTENGEYPLFGTNYLFNGYLQESIIWTRSVEADRAALQANINSRYS